MGSSRPYLRPGSALRCALPVRARRLPGAAAAAGRSAGGGSAGHRPDGADGQRAPRGGGSLDERREAPLNRATSFDGSGSTDANGDALTYRWTLASRPAGSSAASSAASGAAVDLTADVPGDYVVTLVVSDGKLDSSPASATVRAANTAPVANAGIDRSLRVGETAVLDGSGSSDVNGDA